MKRANEVQRGDWIIDRAGAYQVDGVTVTNGLAYIGTRHGILVLPSDTPVCCE